MGQFVLTIVLVADTIYHTYPVWEEGIPAKEAFIKFAVAKNGKYIISLAGTKVKAVFTPAWVEQIADMLAESKGVIREREEVLSKLMVGFENGQKPEFVPKYFVDGRVIQKAPVTPKKAASKGKTTKK